jgi:FkbM family methyltransferase
MKTARWIHNIFPFCQLRTARLLLRLNKGKYLKVERRLFKHRVGLNAHRSTVHMLLYMQGEKFLEDDIVFLGPHIKEGMTAFDIGANIGYTTLFLCSRIGPTGRLFSFEPDPDNFDELSDNVRRNNISFCHPFQAAVGSFDGTISFNHGLNGTVNIEQKSDRNCMITSLDSFARKHSIHRIDLIKIDVEGYELDVLKGMSQILNSESRPIVYIEVHPQHFAGKGDPKKVCALLERYYTNINAYLPFSEVRETFSFKNKLTSSNPSPEFFFNKCKVNFDEAKQNTKMRYQLLCLP